MPFFVFDFKFGRHEKSENQISVGSLSEPGTSGLEKTAPSGELEFLF